MTFAQNLQTTSEFAKAREFLSGIAKHGTPIGGGELRFEIDTKKWESLGYMDRNIVYTALHTLKPQYDIVFHSKGHEYWLVMRSHPVLRADFPMSSINLNLKRMEDRLCATHVSEGNEEYQTRFGPAVSRKGDLLTKDNLGRLVEYDDRHGFDHKGSAPYYAIRTATGRANPSDLVKLVESLSGKCPPLP